MAGGMPLAFTQEDFLVITKTSAMNIYFGEGSRVLNLNKVSLIPIKLKWARFFIFVSSQRQR